MAPEETGDREFLIYLLIYNVQIKLAYLQLITILVCGSSSPKSHQQSSLNFNKNLEKYVLMYSFSETAALLKMDFF